MSAIKTEGVWEVGITIGQETIWGLSRNEPIPVISGRILVGLDWDQIVGTQPGETVGDVRWDLVEMVLIRFVPDAEDWIPVKGGIVIFASAKNKKSCQ